MPGRTRTMNVSLTGELGKFVDALVRSGEFASASEVIRAALRSLKAERDTHLAWMRREVGAGLRQLDRGEGIPADKAFAELRQRFGRLRKSA